MRRSPPAEATPEPGQLLRVRGQEWIVPRARTSRQAADEFAALLDLLLKESHRRVGLRS